MTREAVTTRSDRGQQSFAMSEIDSQLDVLPSSASYDDSWMLVDRMVTDPPQFGIPSIIW
jgi:hypothetical protein